MDNWEKVFETSQVVRAEIARSVLEENGINAVILNKQSSSYVIFGLCEVHVPVEDAQAAKQILTHDATLRETE
ncbi:hypothetical protein GCM10027275_27450 [Rhabdobacter roseus]|uniref:DUF2007 domain-containing protein n=1 Tax=Rhabdobacter roseus TaxID=1655419 RepID=A0A840TSZ9_9BACT|nr:DUF2007 domain-containing protein [Rhabdobacter roseus]MBB5284692.1 hypothetical protein [Rhabdobacter roseus]